MSSNKHKNSAIKYNTRFRMSTLICPNCGKSPKDCVGVTILDRLVGNLVGPRHHVHQVAALFETFKWHRDNVPNVSHIVKLARYALVCRGVTGMGINKMATKIAAIVHRKATGLLPPKNDD